jgi:Flp pilus assembly protein TadG
MRRPGTCSDERGAAAVEFAIVLPVLLAILCGTIDWGFYFYTREVVVNASREGARVGTLQFASGVNPATEAANAARSYLSGSLEAGRVSAAVITTNENATGIACPAQSSCVRITYPIGGSVTGFLKPFVPTSIVAYAEMRK